MYIEYANAISEEDLLYEPSERPSNISLPPGMSYLLFGAWGGICLVGFALIFLMKLPVIGTVIIAAPTFLIMVLRPTFALCIMMLILPTGSGVAAGTVFSLDRGVAIAIALSFLFNLMISQPTLRIRNKALWIQVGYTGWILLISLTSPVLGEEMLAAFTAVQMLGFAFIVYWIIETNGKNDFRWVLRSYVVGALATTVITHITGAAIESMEQFERSGRYTATLGRFIDANMLSVLIGLAILTAVYLIITDRSFFFRFIYLIAIMLLPVMMIKTGSRGGLIALFVTFTSPLLFLRQVLRRPILAIALFLSMIMAAAMIGFLLEHSTIGIRAQERLTDKADFQKGFEIRKQLVLDGVNSVLSNPMGTTRLGWFVSHKTVPHNDFVYTLAMYGIPGATFFATFIIMAISTVKRIPLGTEKLYARAIVTFLLVAGLSLGQTFAKYYWIFMVIAITCERIAWLKSQNSEYIESQTDEETESIDY